MSNTKTTLHPKWAKLAASKILTPAEIAYAALSTVPPAPLDRLIKLLGAASVEAAQIKIALATREVLASNRASKATPKTATEIKILAAIDHGYAAAVTHYSKHKSKGMPATLVLAVASRKHAAGKVRKSASGVRLIGGTAIGSCGHKVAEYDGEGVNLTIRLEALQHSRTKK
tara:strand:+ start:9756 stop:10271 length:516 start_codon:yes stop_codon:yes gene_type:complete